MKSVSSSATGAGAHRMHRRWFLRQRRDGTLAADELPAIQRILTTQASLLEDTSECGVWRRAIGCFDASMAVGAPSMPPVPSAQETFGKVARETGLEAVAALRQWSGGAPSSKDRIERVEESTSDPQEGDSPVIPCLEDYQNDTTTSHSVPEDPVGIQEEILLLSTRRHWAAALELLRSCRRPKLEPQLVNVLVESGHWLIATSLYKVCTHSHQKSMRRMLSSSLCDNHLWEAAVMCAAREDINLHAANTLSWIPPRSRWMVAIDSLNRLRQTPSVRLLLATLESFKFEDAAQATVSLLLELVKPGKSLIIEMDANQSRQPNRIAPERWLEALAVASKLPVPMLRRPGMVRDSVDSLLRDVTCGDQWDAALAMETAMRTRGYYISKVTTAEISRLHERRGISSLVSNACGSPSSDFEYLVAEGEWAPALALLQNSTVDSLPWQTQVHLLALCAKRSTWKIAAALHIVMTTRGVTVPPELFLRVVARAAAAGVWETAFLLGHAACPAGMGRAALRSALFVLLAKACRKAGRWKEAMHNLTDYRKAFPGGSSSATFDMISETVGACTVAGFSLWQVQLLLSFDTGDEQPTWMFSDVERSSSSSLALWIALLHARSQQPGDLSSWETVLKLLTPALFSRNAALSSSSLAACIDICQRQSKWQSAVSILATQQVIGIPIDKHAAHSTLCGLGALCSPSRSDIWRICCGIVSGCDNADDLLAEEFAMCSLRCGCWEAALVAVHREPKRLPEHLLHRILLSEGIPCSHPLVTYAACHLPMQLGDQRHARMIQLCESMIADPTLWSNACALCAGSSLVDRRLRLAATLVSCSHTRRFRLGATTFEQLRSHYEVHPDLFVHAAVCLAHSAPAGENYEQVSSLLSAASLFYDVSSVDVPSAYQRAIPTAGL